MLDHLLGVNGFFTDLAGYARTHPAASLLRWWSEPQATAVYALAGIRPDGHGIWHHHGHTVGFFLEHDRGTENHRTLLAKLPAYQRLVVTGPRYPVLFHLPSIDREVRLQHNLAAAVVGVSGRDRGARPSPGRGGVGVGRPPRTAAAPRRAAQRPRPGRCRQPPPLHRSATAA